MTLPLSGIKVLEFAEHGFVPSASAVLADWGADVVKIERPEGDPMRQIIRQGLVPDVDGYDYLFQLVNRNKRGVSIDVLDPAGREVLERLVRWADVYITNQLPRVRRKLRTDPEDLFALNPRRRRISRHILLRALPLTLGALFQFSRQRERASGMLYPGWYES